MIEGSLPAPNIRITMTRIMIISGTPKPNIINDITGKGGESMLFHKDGDVKILDYVCAVGVNRSGCMP
jgi:hypothetical protein